MARSPSRTAAGAWSGSWFRTPARLSGAPVVALTRAPAAETAARITMGFVRADMDYVPGAVEAVAPDQAEPNAAQTSVSIVFSEGEARAVAERWLSEGRVARDSAAFALPPS